MKSEQIHFIGIGGIGMSSLAKIVLQRGGKVSGSDSKPSAVTEVLSKEGAVFYHGHHPDHVLNAASVVYTTAVSEDNPEFRKAKEKGIPLLHRSELLQLLMQDRDPLLVTGTHGKTTTSALLAHTLVFSNRSPSFSVGGIIQSLQTNGGDGKSRWFVAEADESDGSFLHYNPYGAIITNIDLDHLDFWKEESRLIQGIAKFTHKVQNESFLFWCADDVRLSSLGLKGNSYGYAESADLQILNTRSCGWKSVFDIRWKDSFYRDIEVPLIGKHNILNATAVFGICKQVGLTEEDIRFSFSRFLGVGRRVEKKGEHENILFYDDYAHHPTEIETTLAALKQTFQNQRLVVLFQPHRYTRTRDCFHQFAAAFDPADVVVLTDIYSAGEEPIPSISAASLYERVKIDFKNECYYFPKDQIVEKLVALLSPNDVVVTMGAGDITHVCPKIMQRLQV